MDVAMGAPVPGALIWMEERDGGNEGEGIERRRFLNWTWKILGAGLAVEAAWTTYDILVPRPSGAFGGVVEAGTAEQFPDGTVRYFLSGRFYVTSYQGALVALYQKCPHLGCRVPFCDSSKLFECPCHGSAFNIKGEYIQGPAPRGMDRFPVRIEGERVLVDTSSVIEGPARAVMTGPREPAGASCLEGGTETGDTGLTGGGAGADTDHMGETSESPEATP